MRLLKLLPSERHAEHFQRGIDRFLLEGQGLYRCLVSSDAELAAFEQDYAGWISAASDWLTHEVSRAAADEFAHPHGNAAYLAGSFNEAHGDMRLALSWRLMQLRELAKV
ncbi:MAG: hypothetical protein HY323_05300 [Betaproteobacteria bacterium]|nr:hypothetical protein [Betaproteobacteria bacterium]